MKTLPQKSCFSWLLSEGTFSCWQMNFWKNVKVFPFICRVIMRGLFYKGHNRLFVPKNIFANVYILQSRVLGYMEGFKEKSIKLLANHVLTTQKCHLYIEGTFIRGYNALCIEHRNFWFTRWKTPLAVATKWEDISVFVNLEGFIRKWKINEIFRQTVNFYNLVSLLIWRHRLLMVKTNKIF